MNIAVLGAGAWGSALASSLAAYHRVTLWGRDGVQMSSLAKTGYNSAYLPGVRLHGALGYSDNLEQILAAHAAPTDLIIVATPLSALRDCFGAIVVSGSSAAVLWLCKGIERESKLLPHQIAAEVLNDDTAFGVLSGPSFAQEVAQSLPCALVLASNHPDLNADFASSLHHANLRIYHSTDVIGVEIGGALKNVLAIAAGICDGMKLGLNARAALLTRGIAEMMRLGHALGAQTATLNGLAGVGDLILTATGGLSRNRTVGLELAAGRRLEAITQNLGHVAEGVLCAHAMKALADDAGVDMPITDAVCAVLDGLSPQEALQQLLMREPSREA
jgi:glycerol-3-phosphate dehydrogenase (NAD(P)+)